MTRRLMAGAAILAALWFFSPDVIVGQATAPASPQAPAGRGRGIVVAPRADDPANASADLAPKPAMAALSPDEQAKRFWLPAGYRIDAVLGDPDIDNPGQIAFDGNGRMFVIELRGYEQTREGQDILRPIGRISVHEDRDGDGKYEHHRVFVDKLLLPRFVLPFGANAILALENDGDELWRFTDTNNDGVADEKVVFATNVGRGGALGGQPSGLVWALDNWLYSTVNAFRLRWTPGGVLREPTGANGAQWGATQDDDGKMWFQAGASGLPGYFQFPIHYGTFNWPDQLDPALNATWGAPIMVGDISGGLPATRMPDGSLMYVTAGAGNDVFRGDRLPKDLVGDYLYGEIVARIVRRLKPVHHEGLTRLENAYDRSEFIKSLDPYFRPVDMATAPDGTLYIVDMYRGVVEWAQGARVGTYLRQKIDQYQMDRISSHGRIFRVTYDGMPRDKTPRMLQETPVQLVAHLSHPNGWWRDTAQQLLVLKQDRSVVPALERLVRRPGLPPQGSEDPVSSLPRMHALWTLEGLDALDGALVRAALRDASPRLRRQAIRASETLYKRGDRSFVADYRALAKDPDVDVRIQALLTMNLLKVPETDAVLKSASAASEPAGVRFIASAIVTAAGTAAARGAGLSPDQQASIERGRGIYSELCFSCHGEDGRGAPQAGAAAGVTMAPSLAGAPRVNGHRNYLISVLLHGLTGAVDGRQYASGMVPMGSNKDEWIADVASYVRSSFGNVGSFVSAADVARVRAASPRTSPWTTGELDATLPVALVLDERWKVTASHASANATAAFGLSGWATGAPQQAGMWFQVELPQETTIAEVQFNSPQQGGGRNGPPPAQTYPRAWRLEASTDGTTWGAPVLEGTSAGASTTMAFAPVRARFLRLSLTAHDAAPAWAMQRLRIYRVP